LTFQEVGECHLAKLDPWDPQVIPYLYPNWNPLKMCRISHQMHVELKNSTIRMLNETYVFILSYTVKRFFFINQLSFD
ncbi:hypothetical protein WUBG_09856, partial [Wuchereria bancrofti]